MKKLVVAVTIACLETILLSISTQGGRLAFDPAGNLFERGKDSIFKFTPDGKKSTFASGLSTGRSTRLGTDGVYNLAFDAAGDLFVSDEDSHSILKFTPDGKKSTFASGLGTYGVYNLAFDAAGNLFVSDGDSHSILKFTSDGKKSTFATGFNPTGMAFDDKGNLFVADQEHSIFKFTPDGTRSTFANDLSTVGGSGFETNSMVFDRSGNLFESDDRGQRIIKFSPDGTQSAFASWVRGDLAFDGAGNLFVADHVSRSILKFTPDGTRSSFTVDVSSTSPDKKWEFVGGEQPRILEAGTNQVVLDLSEDRGRGGLVWAPDSKRFAFNYSVHGHRGYTFESVAFYELRGGKWVALHSPADDLSEGSQLVQRLKEHLPKKFNPRDCAPDDDILEFREWTDSSTAILYAPCYGRKAVKLKAAFLFALKFDDAGNWKIVKTHQMSDKEIEKEDAGENVSGPAQTTDQEGLSADASFREADRHLNEVYNALRARLSPSESDTLKKEQLAWINQRNAAGQLAKGNAEGNPTDVADREVTKMTLARAAELEKRLKKAK
jgi:uncharacterized protein YecT (DUF1311 family)